MTELRRNPLTTKWVVYDSRDVNLTIFDHRRRFLTDNNCLYPSEMPNCPYCPGQETENTVEILSVIDNRFVYRNQATMARDWSVRVRAARNPIFRIEEALHRKPRRLYDTMGALGAHETIIMTPTHNKAAWDLDLHQTTIVLLTLRERMLSLERDKKLGHQFAYQIYGQETGAYHNHAVMNLVVSPYIMEKIQKELSGAHTWFQMKERCLFCDIYQEELMKQEKMASHGIIDVSDHFTAFIPFFASHAFEIWILPVEHYSSFTDISSSDIPELAYLFLKIMKRLRAALGPVPYLVCAMNRPNIQWGSNRGYWQTIHKDWHWRLKIVPEVCFINDSLRGFFYGTGSRVNPLLPEDAADYLRRY